jgi:hypothetical protein
MYFSNMWTIFSKINFSNTDLYSSVGKAAEVHAEDCVGVKEKKFT